MMSNLTQMLPQVKDNGITTLAEPADKKAIIDIVFVHGFNGHPRNTWLHEPNAFYWPLELRNLINDARIMVFGYDANIRVLAAKNLMGIRDHAVNLLARLRNERATFPASKRPLVFVCHSMGGLVVKEALIISTNDPNFRSLNLSTAALFFFGTPHRGAAALDTKRLGLLINVSKIFFAKLPGDLETALATRSRELFAINDRFRNIALLLENKLSITCFFERVETAGLGDVVVDQDSAALGYTGEEDVGLLADHRGLVRYQDVEDDLYDFVTKTMLFKLDKILQEGRKQQVSSQVLGNFSGHMMLRELRKIPFLTWLDWFKAVPALGISWGGEAQIGVARIGRYSETWMNLLLIFGAENIVNSPYIRQLPINPDDLPQDLTNPFAIELGIAAILVGIAGCDTVVFNGSLPVFRGSNVRLEFTQSGSNTLIGRFSQELGLPAHLKYAPRTVARASAYAGGTFFYGFQEPVPALASSASYLETMQSPSLFHDLRAKQCRCPNMTEFSFRQRIGLRVPALALLAADSPTVPRCFPSQACQIMETVQELSNLCSFWRTEENRRIPQFKEKFRPVINDIGTVFRVELLSMAMMGDRYESRLTSLLRRGMTPGFIDLGFSWLASHERYHHEASDTRIKARPEWTSFSHDTSLVLLEDAMLACDIYLRAGEISALYEGIADKAYFHTCLSSQLQEVDWWLGTRQALTACETSNILNQMPIFGSSSTRKLGFNGTTLTLFTERRLVRAMLVFRAVLLAVLLGLGLDNSAFEGTELGQKTVILR